MSKYSVQFGIIWQSYGTVSVELPDDVDHKDLDAVRQYVLDQWDEIPLPSGEYISGSDELDEESLSIYPNPTRFIGNVMAIENDVVRVEWENADEGLCGDYDPDDPDDVNLLRFYVYRKDGQEWVPVDDASYCTEMPAGTDEKILRKALELLLKEFTNVLRTDPHASVKRLGESLTYIAPDWFEDKITKRMVYDGIRKKVIRFIKDPYGLGVACQIGAHWFYHDEFDPEEEMTLEKYDRVSLKNKARAVYETLKDFCRDAPENRDEYNYYVAYLKENLGKADSQ